MILRYAGCVARRSTAIITVFSILSRITRPTRVLRLAILVPAYELALLNNREKLGHLFTSLAHFIDVVQLHSRLSETEI